MAQYYTPEPQVDAEILTNTGTRALTIKREDNGDVWLNIYEWHEDKRYSERKGNWGVPMFGTVHLTLEERKAVIEALR